MKKLLVAVFARGYNNYSYMYDSLRHVTRINQHLTPEQNEKLSILEKEAYNIRKIYIFENQTKNLEAQRIIN
jgi:hypothetical protein